MRPVLLLVLVLAVALPLGFVLRDGEPQVASGAVESPPTVRCVGLMVNAPIGGGSEDFPDLAFQGSQERTRVALKLDFPAGGLIDLDREASSLTAFRDDRGRDLTAGEDDFFGPFEMMPRVAEDGRSLVCVARSKQLPSPGTTALHVAGELAVVAADEKGEAHGELKLEEGATATVGPYTFEVVETGDNDWGEGWAFTLKTTTDTAPIVRWALLDDAGAELELDKTMSMSGGSTWQQGFACPAPLEAGTLLVEYWVSPRTVRVPFDVSATPGLR